ncbi:MAG: ArsA family ATPase [Halobacteriaceae archaeon]
MDELEVEAVESLETAPEAPDYVLYGGKGGVGKTTMAAATGLASAEAGTPTLVVSTDPAHSLSDTLDRNVPERPAPVHDEYPLYAVEIDPDEAMEEAALFGEGGEVGGMGGLGELLGGDDGVLGGAMPGADEAAAVQQLMRYLDDERFERVVVDTAPTGHTLRLLELPEMMDSMMGRIVQMRERFSGLLDGMPGVGGDEEAAAGPDLDEVRERVERLRRTLRDPALTDFRIVMVPEEMSVRESNRLREQLRTFEIPVGTVVVNRVMEDFADVTGVDTDPFVSPDLEHCDFCQRRWDVQQEALGAAQDLFRDHDVKRVPLFADEVRGEQMLRVCAACLR